MDQEITRIQLLTDQGASAFYEQVTAYMENKYGLIQTAAEVMDELVTGYQRACETLAANIFERLEV